MRKFERRSKGVREHRGSSNYTGSVGRENGGVAYTGGIVPTLYSTYTVDGVGVRWQERNRLHSKYNFYTVCG